MSDKELIKEEIERQKSFYKKTFDVLHPDDLDATIAYAHIELLDRLIQFIDSLPEESTDETNCTTKNDDLEEAAVEAFKKIVDSGNNSFLEIFKAGVEWQKDKMNLLLQTEYEKGLFDLNKAMMKDAINGEIGDIMPLIDVNEMNSYIKYIKSHKLKSGDKVKIIIIKED